MRHIKLDLVVVLLVVLATTGCVRKHGFVRRDVMVPLVGAVAGGLIGSRIGNGARRLLATTFASVAGAMVGGQIGHHLNDRDRHSVLVAANHALSMGYPRATTWNNPVTGHTGTVRVIGTAASPEGCRNIKHTTNDDGRRISEVQRWCMTGKDTWQFQSIVNGSV